MYAGTLIEELMGVVERVEKSPQSGGARGDVEARIFGLQGSEQKQAERVFAGAA
jgi:hypothetical protein